MNTQSDRSEDETVAGRVIEISIRLAVLAVVVIWCVLILSPFLTSLLWGMIIAVALFPMHRRLERALGGRRGLTATLMGLLLLLVIMVPTVFLAGSLVESTSEIILRLEGGPVTIPPPPSGLTEWPVVGKPIVGFWMSLSGNLETALGKFAPQLRAAAGRLLSAAANAGLAFLQFLLSILVAALLLARAEEGSCAAQKLARKLAGSRGDEYARVAGVTVRAVARGVLGVALIQAALAGAGLYAAGVPAAGLWTFVCLLLTVIQIGPLPVMIPTIIYLFATADTFTAVAFLIWGGVVGVSDNVLKPILLGRGADTPMLVVFLGSLGGFITSGIVGLFVGAVVLALGYQLLITWMNPGAPIEAPATTPGD